jgi:hypothetical protein
MSPVLRPKSFIKAPPEELETRISDQLSSIEDVSTHEEVIPTPLVIDDQVTQVNTSNGESSQVAQDSPTEGNDEKDAKISAVLQEILDRKIDKAIISAESSLATVIPNTLVSTQEEVNVPVVTSPQDVVPTVSVGDTMLVQSVPVEVVKTPGQEIHIPVVTQTTLPENGQITTSSEAVVSPVVSDVNVIPVHIATEVATPVVTPEQIAIPVTASPTPLTAQPAQVTPAAAPSEKKVHWFDKLFGSAPKNPPQTA